MANNSETVAKLMERIRSDVARRRENQFPRTSFAAGEAPFYEWGGELRFGLGGNGGEYLDQGWSSPEAGYTWSDGVDAHLAARVKPSDRIMLLECGCIPLVAPPLLAAQRVRIYAGDDLVGEWRVAASGTFCGILGAPSAGEALRLRFHFPDAAAPQKLGVNADSRRLGIALQRLVISPLF